MEGEEEERLSKVQTPERVNVKTRPKRGLADLRRRMTDACIDRVRRNRASVISKLRCGTGQLHGPEPTQEEKLRTLQEVARDIVSMVEVDDEEGGDELMGNIRAAALGDEQDDMSEEEYLDMMQQIEEAVIAEILEQEQAQLQDYLDHELAEEEALQEAAARHEQDEAACPVCLKSKLHKHGTTFFCECGMRLNVHGDQLTLQQLKENLVACFEDHASTGCTSHPACAVQECGGYDMLLMACGECDFVSVVA